MATFSPKWAMNIYAQLWLKFNTDTFSREQSEKTIKENNQSLALSRLKKDGWLSIGLDPDDGRKSLYTLKPPEDVIKEIAIGTHHKKEGNR